MKCKVCGAESGKYPLCRACNLKRERGEIIKCSRCGNWHYANMPCPVIATTTISNRFLYAPRKTLISKSEQTFYNVIKSVVPDGYCVFPQINLASFIDRTDDARFHNELFRNIDFLVTDAEYVPKFIIEINDQTHLYNDRKERDEKIRKICEEAGIPILKLWTSYGANPEYIKKRINEILSVLPVARVHHFNQSPEATIIPPPTPSQDYTIFAPRPQPKKQNGCYIATCVYGSYDCPPVWTLRRYRDETLSKTWLGRAFIRLYYAISPRLVKIFGPYSWFHSLWKPILDGIVLKLQSGGVEDTSYNDISYDTLFKKR